MAQDVKIVLSAEDRTRAAIEGVIGRLGDMTSASAIASRGLGALGAAFSVGAITAWAKATVDGIDALNDLADATGSSVENISALENIARRTGTSFDTVGGALVKFNQALGNAKPGSDAEQALSALGLSVKDLKAQDPAQALLATAMALQSFADDGNKARITQELFGKSLREVAPLLKDLAEKGTLNATVSTAAAQEAERFNKEMSALGKNALDASRSLAMHFIPKINETIDLYRQGAKEGKNFYQVMIDEQLRLLGLRDGPKEYAKRLADINEQLETGTLHESRRNALMRERAALAAKLQASPLDDTDQRPNETRRFAYRPSLPSVLGGSGKNTSAAKTPTIGNNTEELRAYAAGLADLDRINASTAAKTDGLSKTQEKLREIMASPVWGSFGRQQREQLGYAAALAQAEEDRSTALDAAVKTALARQEARSKEAEGIREFISAQEASDLAAARMAENATKAAQAEFDAFGKTKSQLAELTLARLQDSQAGVSAGTVAYEAIQRQIDAQKQLIDVLQKGEFRDTAIDAADKAEKAWRQTADSINSSLTDALLRGFENGKDFGQNFSDTLENMIKTAILRPMLAKVLDPISMAVSSGISSLLSFDGGGYTGSGLRTGGLDGKGGFLAMMHPDETVVDHTKGGSAGPQQTINVVQNFTVGDVASVSLVRQAVAGSERRIATSLSRSMNYGGAVA
jgi:hypothetical protein